MAYSQSKKFVARRGRRTGKATWGTATSRKFTKKDLREYVKNEMNKELKRALRGPPRSVAVNLTPCRVNRRESPPVFSTMQSQEWPAYLNGSKSERKYALLPISELIPSQRPIMASPDDGQRRFDKVFIKGVSLRISLIHAEGVRLMLFAFRNGNRRGLPATTVTRPYQLVQDKSEVARSVKYEILTRQELYGEVLPGEQAARHIGYHEGPFAVLPGSENPRWKSTDGTSFTSRFSKAEGRPVGRIEVKLDENVKRKMGSVCNLNLLTSSLMRTVSGPVSNSLGTTWTASRFREVEVYIDLQQEEKFATSSESVAVNERPLELFVGFDGPAPFDMTTSKSTVCACITAMDMEVYYA